jgi:hypothetical protein
MYSYEQERAYLFTEDGQVRFLKIRDKIRATITQSGAFRLRELGIVSWPDIACVDRMVELKELVELKRDCWGQYRVFTTPQVHNY